MEVFGTEAAVDTLSTFRRGRSSSSELLIVTHRWRWPPIADLPTINFLKFKIFLKIPDDVVRTSKVILVLDRQQLIIHFTF